MIRAGCPYEWIRRTDEPGLVPYLWSILVELVFLELGAIGRNFGPIVASMGLERMETTEKFVELVVRMLCTWINLFGNPLVHT